MWEESRTGPREADGRTLTDGGRCDEGALREHARLASSHASEGGALLPVSCERANRWNWCIPRL